MGEFVKHGISPVIDKDSRILIVGTMPSPKSREAQFYYAHPRNRFWKVISAVLGSAVPSSVAEKRELLLMSHIALWDVISECEIENASDSSIKNVKPNDIRSLIDGSAVSAVFTNGTKSYELYKRYAEKETGIEAVMLPSTSPANAAYSLDELIKCYSVIKQYI